MPIGPVYVPIGVDPRRLGYGTNELVSRGVTTQKPSSPTSESVSVVSDSSSDSTPVGPGSSSSDLFEEAKNSYEEAVDRAEEYAEQANVANRDYFDYTFEKSQQEADRALERSNEYLRDYYSNLVESIRRAGLNPNLVLGQSNVSAPQFMASGASTSQHKADSIYQNLFMEVLLQQMTNSNKTLNTVLGMIPGILKALV